MNETQSETFQDIQEFYDNNSELFIEYHVYVSSKFGKTIDISD